MKRNGEQPLSLYGRDGRRKYVTPSERQQFMLMAEQTPGLVALLGLVLAHTGCRISEALALRLSSVECQECFIAIRSLKKRGLIVVREIPVPAALIARVLKECVVTAHPDARLFPWSRGWAWHLIKSGLLTSGCRTGPHCTPKGLRHGFGIQAIRSGVPLTLVRKWLGHASLETTAIYLDVVGIEEREFAERMWSKR